MWLFGRKKPADQLPKKLTGITVAVSLQKSDEDSLVLEQYLEQALLGRDARMVHLEAIPGSHQEFASAFRNAHFVLNGTLLVCEDGVRHMRMWTEDEEEFQARHAEYLRAYGQFQVNNEYHSIPKPELPLPKQSWVIDVPMLLYCLNFKVIGRDGVVLASSECEARIRKDAHEHGSTLKELAEKAVRCFDREDIWEKVVLT